MFMLGKDRFFGLGMIKLHRLAPTDCVIIDAQWHGDNLTHQKEQMSNSLAKNVKFVK